MVGPLSEGFLIIEWVVLLRMHIRQSTSIVINNQTILTKEQYNKKYIYRPQINNEILKKTFQKDKKKLIIKIYIKIL